MSVPGLTLADGSELPQIGLGLWQVKDQNEFNNAFESALKAGYRHFDTAQVYQNEEFLGSAWQNSGLKREDIFITTKIKVQNFGKRRLKASFEESLQKLKTDYVDLLLLHYPLPILRKKAWRALEEIKESGRAKHIGVSNYTIRHLEGMNKYASQKPASNQVELHVFLQQPELIEYCFRNGIAVEAYSPLARASEMNNKTIARIAEKHGKSYAQIMLRWLIEQNLVVLPKSITPSRIQENINIFDFKLDKDDLRAITKLNRNMRVVLDPTRVP